jgi:hypothetical protein
MVKALKKLAHAVSHLRHPVGVMCFDCGFLAMGDEEISLSPCTSVLIGGFFLFDRIYGRK